MGLFGNSSKQIEMVDLPFMLDTVSMPKAESDAGTITIEAKYDLNGISYYLSETFELGKKSLYKNGVYEEIVNLLKNTDAKLVKTRVVVKNDKVKDFSFQLSSLTELYDNDIFSNMDALYNCIDTKSCNERGCIE